MGGTVLVTGGTGYIAGELIDQLLQLAQVQRTLGRTGKAHGQLSIRGQLRTVQPLKLALDHGDLQRAAGQVLLGGNHGQLVGKRTGKQILGHKLSSCTKLVLQRESLAWHTLDFTCYALIW